MLINTLYLQLLVRYFQAHMLYNMSYFRYLCLFAYSGVQHILCCVFVLFFFALCILCCKFLWLVHLWWPIRYFPTFIILYNWPFCRFLLQRGFDSYKSNKLTLRNEPQNRQIEMKDTKSVPCQQCIYKACIADAEEST